MSSRSFNGFGRLQPLPSLAQFHVYHNLRWQAVPAPTPLWILD